MNPLEYFSLQCPWCSESIDLEIDLTFADQEYIEDCSVCCAPILVQVSVPEDGEPRVELHRDNE